MAWKRGLVARYDPHGRVCHVPGQFFFHGFVAAVLLDSWRLKQERRSSDVIDGPGAAQSRRHWMEDRGNGLPARQRSLSADWILDESWWGEGADRLPACPADNDQRPPGTHNDIVAPKAAAAAAFSTAAAGCSHGDFKHREMRVYLGASTWVPPLSQALAMLLCSSVFHAQPDAPLHAATC